MRWGTLRSGLLKLINDLPDNITMIEIGCYKGESSEMFLLSGKVKKLYAVDTWEGERWKPAEEEFDKRIVQKFPDKVVKLKSTIQDAVPYIKDKIDFIYIDALHDYNSVKSDILSSLEIVKERGVIAGHDYANSYDSITGEKWGVIQAVSDTIEKPDRVYEDTSWIKSLNNFINIITPCSRPSNLYKISESINIPRENYRWIVVFDKESIPEEVPSNCEAYAIKVKGSTSGNGQRNYALDLVKKGYIYFNDDDTTVHPLLWYNIKNVDNDLISFMQANKNGSMRLKGNLVALNSIDSHNFIMHYSLLGDTRWVLERYDADGVFANIIWKKSLSYLYIPQVLSVYNSLR